jgi:hypothetical protein
MADTLKEIYNGTVTMSGVASTGAFTMVTTDASTQYVIKDVHVIGALPGSTDPVLQVNGFSVGSLLLNLSGSEIVDINSTIKYCAYSVAPTLKSIAYKAYDHLNLAFKTGNYCSINGATSAASTDATSSSAVSSGFSSYNNITALAVSSNGSVIYVYGDGNSSFGIYRREGGVNGTETTIINSSYAWGVSDGASNIYYSGSSGLVHKYNIETGSTTSFSCGYTTYYSYPNAYYMNNGMILAYTGNNTDQYLIINPTTGATAIIYGLSSWGHSGTYYHMTGYYDASTDRYTIYRVYNTVLKKAVLNAAVTMGSAYQSGVTEISCTFPYAAYLWQAYATCTATTFSWGLHNVTGKTQLSTINASTAIVTTADWLPFSTYTGAIFTVVSTASGSVFSNGVPVRITGIKST